MSYVLVLTLFPSLVDRPFPRSRLLISEVRMRTCTDPAISAASSKLSSAFSGDQIEPLEIFDTVLARLALTIPQKA